MPGSSARPTPHSFDAAGRITRITGDGPDWNYTYDALGRLTRATQGADTYTYTLDQVGNILDGGRSHDVNHRLTADANKSYSYDQRGNLTLEQDRTTGARTVYSWNTRNQLLKVDFFPNAAAVSPSRTLSYAYDPLGRRASKTDSGVVQRFVYDGDDLVGTLDASNSVVGASVFSGSVDEPLSATTGVSTKFLYSNAQRSVMAVADGGALTHSYRYSPVCFTGLRLPLKDTIMYAVGVFALQYIVMFIFPGVTGYSGWLLFGLLIGRVLGIPHPPSEIEEPLDQKRKVLGWIALAILVLCFTPNPINIP